MQVNGNLAEVRGVNSDMHISFAVIFTVSLLACASPQRAHAQRPLPTTSEGRCPMPRSWSEISPMRAGAIATNIEHLSTTCRQSAAVEIETTARRWHARAFGCQSWCAVGCDKITEPRLARAAARLYRLSMSDDLASFDSNSRYAELLWALADVSKHDDDSRSLWMAAAEAFDSTTDGLVSKNVRRESAHAAMLAWKHSLAVDPGEPSATLVRCLGSKALSRRARRFIVAAHKYGRYLRDGDEELLWMRFWEANLYARGCDHARALPLLRGIIETQPDSEVGVRAAELGVEALSMLGRIANVTRWKTALEVIQKRRAQRPKVAL